MKRCSRCIYDETVPGITFDADGVCQYCHLHDELDAQYPTGDKGWARLCNIAKEIAVGRQHRKYDVVVGVSGGCDSSFTLMLAVMLGLRPVAVHFDNTWNGAAAVRNIQKMVNGLGVPFYSYVADNKEYDAINRAFLLSGTRDFEAPTDIALTTVLYRAAEQFSVKYIFNGHSFRTEGIAPLGWSYMDGRYIADVCKRFNGPKRFAHFPNLWLRDFMRYSLSGIKRVRPLYYIDYQKQGAKRELVQMFGWEWYGGHHHENELTAFFMYYYLPRKFGIDLRKLGWSAQIRSGQMSRSEALARIEEPPEFLPLVLESVKRRLGLSDSEFEAAMQGPNRTHFDFKTYQPFFRATRPFWWAMVKTGKVPQSFYIKYCQGIERINSGARSRTRRRPRFFSYVR